jgi:hypothetical protein
VEEEVSTQEEVWGMSIHCRVARVLWRRRRRRRRRR